MQMTLPCKSLTGDVCTNFDLETHSCAGKFMGKYEKFARILNENEDVFKNKKITGQ